VQAVSIDDAGQPFYVMLATVWTFTFSAIAYWTQDSLAKGCEVIYDGLACFRSVAEVCCVHQSVIVKVRHPNALLEFRWFNTVLSNLKASFNGTFHALRIDKYSDRSLDTFSCRISRRFIWQFS
jgi:hypothetical protein